MIRRMMLLLSISCFLTGVACAQTHEMHSLSWISGDWQLTSDKGVIEEHWTQPADDTLVGLGRIVKDGRTALFEYLRLELRDGDIYYVWMPGGKRTLEFKLVESDAQHAVFQSSNERFQRVIYRREGADGLFTTFEGTLAGTPTKDDFHYKRVVPR